MTHDSKTDAGALRLEALRAARDFIDPDRDPPRMTNRELVALIDAALRAPAQSCDAGSETLALQAVRADERLACWKIAENERATAMPDKQAWLVAFDIANAIKMRDFTPTPAAESAEPSKSDEDEEMRRAREFLREKPSTSYLQRKMQITYNHASGLIRALENEGFISGADSAGRRTVLHPSASRETPNG